MEAFLSALMINGVSELGDKTQFLVLFLAARFSNMGAVIGGLVVALLANHVIASLFGIFAHNAINPASLRIALGIAFLLLAAWALMADTTENAMRLAANYGAFMVTLVSYFLAEFADKTQIATVALAAHYGAFVPVVLGSVLGVLAIDLPTILIGKATSRRLPPRVTRYASSAVFALFGMATLVDFRPHF